MSDDQFTKLFNYMEQRFSDIDRRFDAVDARFDTCFGAIDALAKQVETCTQEVIIIGHQLSRHDRQINQLANHAKIKLVA